ncbi:CocE/NonD family hydrolase [Actinosynnema sp. NPDC050436]|uniref:alpha/beta hydrolase family protein n=1 Tax=Actinosynnema sp. NPDC050436 TaxID=3155659 RepID=UPI0033DC02BD
MKRWVVRTVVALVALTLVTGGWVVHQNTYDLREERVEIGDLRGVLALPETGERHGLVVFVHGDGPVDATHETFYRPMWEAFARAGYASLSWDKPGVDGAPGNWLHQTMADRSREVLDAIAWAKGRPDVDPGRIGLWGASQAGWVMPRVARQPDVAFMIAVSPAVNWHRQGRFNLLAELAARGAPAEEVAAEVARSDTRLEHLRRGSGFEEYRAATGDTDLTADRWRFIAANHESDATDDLARVDVPTLLVLGGHDRNVDVADTESGYRRLVRDLEVRTHPDATHGMTPAGRGDIATTAVAIAAPRSVYAPGYLDDLRRFVEGVR